MTSTDTSERSSQNGLRSALAIGAIAAQLLFIGGCLVFGAIEGRGYDMGRHDISDLGALTASHPVAFLATLGVSGSLTMAFAVGALRPALTAPSVRPPVSPWLLAFSLPALDNLGDVVFRLDCRAADVGCSSSAAVASWHGKMHIAVFAVAVVPTLAAPFALAHRMRLLDRWHDFAGTARTFGILLLLTFGVTIATTGTSVQGWTQRGVILIAGAGIAGLALRVRTIEAHPTRPAGLPPARDEKRRP